MKNEITKPVLKWQGSKTRMLRELIPLVKPHVCFAEHFAGGLAVLLAKERSKVEVVNDINGNLIALYRNLQFHLPALVAEINWLRSSRQNLHDFIAQPGLTELQRAARFLLVNRTSFGGNMNSFGVAKTSGGGVGFDHKKLVALFGAAHERLNGVIIENLPYERSFKNYDSKDTFHFIDPPYLNATNGGYAGWDETQMRKFRRQVGRLQGNWIVTLNDSSFTRDLFAGCQIKSITTINRAVNRRTCAGQTFGEIIITPN